jgi:uroporphyrinogen-III synthase
MPIFKKKTQTLYVGTDPSRYLDQADVIHLPLIQTNPLPISPEIKQEFDAYTHVILTSPNSVRILTAQMKLFSQQIIAIGKGTAAVLQSQGLSAAHIAHPESQEGVIDLLKKLPLENAYLFYPRSNRARPLLASYLQERGLRHRVCDLYETRFIKPSYVPPLDEIEEIIFTSPSTVHAFIELYGSIPNNKKLTCIGPVTLAALEG